MKRMLLGMIMAVAILSFVSMSWAGVVSGELTKIDGSYYIVKGKDGKEQKIHFDNTTVKTGDVKAGAQVEVDANDSGHAKSIKVMEMKMEKK